MGAHINPLARESVISMIVFPGALVLGYNAASSSGGMMCSPDVGSGMGYSPCVAHEECHLRSGD